MSKIKAFEVHWKKSQVRTVLDQVQAYPWPPAPDVADGWAYGCDGAYLRGLCDYWVDDYDWRAAVDELNRFPQFTAKVRDFDLHFVHVVGEAGGKRPLILSHGWPGSHYEFWDVIEKLAYPSRFGGQAADAFDVVIPSLPGYGFSSKPKRPVGPRATAGLFDTLMTEVLGYERYLAQGGDWGSLITSWLGYDHAAHVQSIHLNMIGFRPAEGPTGEAEIAWAKRAQRSGDAKGAYLRLQRSQPQSLAWLGAGNPVGQAAWIAERFHDWSDLSAKSLDEVHPKARLLTNIMIYVMTGSFTTAAWFYRGFAEEGGTTLKAGERCETPTAFASLPGDGVYPNPPRSLAERLYNLTLWTDLPSGGHFAAMEEPDLFVDDLRAWAKQLG